MNAESLSANIIEVHGKNICDCIYQSSSTIFWAAKFLLSGLTQKLGNKIQWFWFHDFPIWPILNFPRQRNAENPAFWGHIFARWQDVTSFQNSTKIIGPRKLNSNTFSCPQPFFLKSMTLPGQELNACTWMSSTCPYVRKLAPLSALLFQGRSQRVGGRGPAPSPFSVVPQYNTH